MTISYTLTKITESLAYFVSITQYTVTRHKLEHIFPNFSIIVFNFPYFFRRVATLGFSAMQVHQSINQSTNQ